MNMDPGCTDSGSDAELRQEGEGPEEKLNDYSDSSDSQDKGPPPVPPSPAKRKQAPGRAKAAAKTRRPSELCHGFEGLPCTFSTQDAGGPARVQPRRGQACCVFCSAAAFRAAAASPRPKILQMLKKLQALDSSNAQKVLDRIRTWEGEDAAARYAAAAKTPVRRKSRRLLLCGRGPEEVLGEEDHASSQTTIPAHLSVKHQRFLGACAKGTQRRLATSLVPALAGSAEVKEVTALCGASGDVATNDTGLPFPKDAMARRVEAWCKHGSWAMCQSCGSMQPRPLQPVDLRRLAPPTISEKACTACRHGEYVPQPDDIPQQLRHLKPRVLRALRPLDIDTGTFQRAQCGYRIHSSMVTFAWASQPVEDKIAALRKRKDRASARAALEYLLGSSYKSFYDRHHAYLQRHGSEMPEKQRKLPLRFLEEEGLEGALWPHLYWRRDLCETVARASHESRQQRKRRRARGALDSDSSGVEDAEDDPAGNSGARSGLGRIKRGFLRKVLSPVVGYGAEYDLLHFVYDLSLWTTIGTKKNVARQFDIPIRLVLSGWTPQYWRIRHLAVLDMQRQCGNAALFRTRAPYERTFPYHAWVLHEQRAVGAPRLQLPGPETLHQAHVLLELDRGLFCGARGVKGRADRTWSQHLLAAVDPPDVNTVLGHVTRLEFQDGKRKGRGRITTVEAQPTATPSTSWKTRAPFGWRPSCLRICQPRRRTRCCMASSWTVSATTPTLASRCGRRALSGTRRLSSCACSTRKRTRSSAFAPSSRRRWASRSATRMCSRAMTTEPYFGMLPPIRAEVQRLHGPGLAERRGLGLQRCPPHPLQLPPA